MHESHDKKEIFSKIKEIIYNAMRVNPEKITTNARIFTDLGAESLDVLDIRFRIEQIFGFKIGDREIIKQLGDNLSSKEIEEKFTVGSIVDYVEKRNR